MQMHETLLLQPTTPRLYSLAPSSFQEDTAENAAKKEGAEATKGFKLDFSDGQFSSMITIF